MRSDALKADKNTSIKPTEQLAVSNVISFRQNGANKSI